MIEMIFFILFIFNAVILLIVPALFSVGFIGFVLMIAYTNTSEYTKKREDNADEHNK